MTPERLDLRKAVNAVSDVIQNRPLPLREFDQIYMKAGDMVMQAEYMARRFDGKDLLFVGDGDAISLCIAYLQNRQCFSYGPKRTSTNFLSVLTNTKKTASSSVSIFTPVCRSLPDGRPTWWQEMRPLLNPTPQYLIAPVLSVRALYVAAMFRTWRRPLCCICQLVQDAAILGRLGISALKSHGLQRLLHSLQFAYAGGYMADVCV